MSDSTTAKECPMSTPLESKLNESLDRKERRSDAISEAMTKTEMTGLPQFEPKATKASVASTPSTPHVYGAGASTKKAGWVKSIVTKIKDRRQAKKQAKDDKFVAAARAYTPSKPVEPVQSLRADPADRAKEPWQPKNAIDPNADPLKPKPAGWSNKTFIRTPKDPGVRGFASVDSEPEREYPAVMVGHNKIGESVVAPKETPTVVVKTPSKKPVKTPSKKSVKKSSKKSAKKAPKK